MTPENIEDRKVPQTTTPEQEEIQLEVPVAPTILPPKSPAFLVRDINIQGSTLFKPNDFDPLTAPFEGREVSLDELGKVVEGINTMYREKGYLTSQAYIPPQDIENGQVTIQILEGVYGDIEVSGNKYYRLRVIERVLNQEPGELMSIPKLEDTLNRINRQNPFRLKAVLSAGDQPGETDIRLEVSEKLPYQISGTFDNQGRPFIGLYRWGAEFNHQSLTGWGDRLTLKWLGADGTQIALASYAVPLNRWGTEIAGNFAFSGVNVDLPDIQNEDIVGRAYNYGLLLTQPLGEKRDWSVDLGWNWRRIRTYIQDDLDSQTDISTIVPGITFNKFDRWGRTFVRTQMSFAPDWLGADENFWKTEAFLTRIQRLPWRNLLILRAYAQFSPDALPAAEQFQLGGAFSVRGYTEGLLIGDRGWNFGIEHRWPIPFLGHISKELDERIQGAFFYDFGQTWLDSSQQFFIGGVSNRRTRTLLQGGGVGLRVRLHRMAQGFIDFGFGLVDRRSVEPVGFGQPTARIHFGIRTDLVPEEYRVRGKKTTVVKGAEAGKVIEFQSKTTAPAEQVQPQEQPQQTEPAPTEPQPETTPESVAPPMTQPAESAAPEEAETVEMQVGQEDTESQQELEGVQPGQPGEFFPQAMPVEEPEAEAAE